jgi:carboxypeptidase C (cathepsin A)
MTTGIKNFKIYVTGESYAGRYVPYISAAMLDEKDKEFFLWNSSWSADRVACSDGLIDPTRY